MKNIETITLYKYNSRVLHINLEGITHAESLISPEKGGNCINWIVGHILLTKNDIYEALGLEKVCDQRYIDLYDRETKGNNLVNPIELEKLIGLFDESQKKIIETLENRDFSNNTDDLLKITFWGFHEAYHTGQLGVMRRIIGKEGAIK